MGWEEFIKGQITHEDYIREKLKPKGPPIDFNTPGASPEFTKAWKDWEKSGAVVPKEIEPEPVPEPGIIPNKDGLW